MPHCKFCIVGVVLNGRNCGRWARLCLLAAKDAMDECKLLGVLACMGAARLAVAQVVVRPHLFASLHN